MFRKAFAQRVLEAEIMDDPALEAQRHHAALRGLSTINLLSGSARTVWRPIARLARELGRERLRVLDVATGAGDIPLALWRKSQRTGLKLEIRGIDISERALDFARQKADASGAKIEFSCVDALEVELPAGYDAIVSSLFLHHLANEQAGRLLGTMARSTNHLLLVNDLRRSFGGWLLAHAAVRVLTRSDVARVDGPRSVRAAFSIPEIRDLALAAGMRDATVSPRWPCRFLLSWRKA